MSLWASRLGHKSKQKKRASVTYSTDRENEVGKIFVPRISFAILNVYFSSNRLTVSEPADTDNLESLNWNNDE